MANELTLTGILAYSDSEGSEVSMDFTEIAATLSSKKFSHVKHNVGITEEAMLLGEVTSLGFCLIKNLDATNFVEIRSATGSTKIVKVLPGKGALFQFGSGVTAPYIIADTGACQCEYLICST